MKKFCGVVLLLLVASCAVTKSPKTDEQGARNLVARFLPYMMHNAGPNYKGMMDCISPEYIKQNSINTANYKVNNYTIYGYSLMPPTGTEIIKAKIWGSERSWQMEIHFKVVKEKGKFYIWPSSHDGSWIHPWWEVIDEY